MYFFDLDGTLLDSNGIWLDIDRDFLARHGISPVPEDYTEYVTHHSFPDAAAYTRRRFGLDMPEEDICRAWLDMALEAYSHQLPLKPGAGEYVRRAHERGERCALLSSCMPELCRAALAHHGLTDCFSHILTAAELGLEKRDPVLYRRAAEICGVPNGDCVLFDDSPLACAAALKGIEIFEREDYMSKIARIEAISQREMLGFTDPRIREVRVMGGCTCVEVYDEATLEGFQQFAYERGVFSRPFLKYMYSMVPYVIQEEELVHIFDVMKEWFRRG